MLGSRATERTPVTLRPIRQRLMIEPVVNFIVTAELRLVIWLGWAPSISNREEVGRR